MAMPALACSCLSLIRSSKLLCSTTTILVKNTPHETTEEEIRAVFAKHGTVSRVIFPPSHTMALVDMPLPQEARAAFRALAYRKFKHVPLYLEWAPEGCVYPCLCNRDKTRVCPLPITAPTPDPTLEWSISC